MAAYSSSNWLNFVSTDVEDEIRGREDYDFSDIEEIRRYQLQFYPIFAITGPIRILITYGIWHYMRNYLVRTDQFTNLSPYLFEFNEDFSARLETWFTLAGLVFFVSSVLLEWLSYICVQAKMSISFWFGNLAGLAACPIILGKFIALRVYKLFFFSGIYDSHFKITSLEEEFYSLELSKHEYPGSIYWFYIAVGTLSVFLTTIYLIVDNSRDFTLIRDLFQLPLINTIFSPISLLLNRKRDDLNDGQIETKEAITPTLFVCVTLWHETVDELTAIVGSLVNLVF